MEIITLNIEYFLEDGNWIARCNEIGLVGYQHKDLNQVRELVKEGLLLHTGGLPFELKELISTLVNHTSV